MYVPKNDVIIIITCSNIENTSIPVIIPHKIIPIISI